VNDIHSTAAAVSLGDTVAEHLYVHGSLPEGSWVGGYVVLAEVVALDGTKESAWFHSNGFGEPEQLRLLRRVQAEMEGG
jgi:hypothetical protein